MKCPVCGNNFGDCKHGADDLINEFNLELNRHEIQTKRDKKEIERLRKLCTEIGIIVLHDKMVEVVQYVSEKINKSTVLYHELSEILEIEP